MTVTLEQMLAEETEESRVRIDQFAAKMRAELNLREIRRLRKLTQSRLSKKLKIGQEGVSRIEKRTDLYLSTLRCYVEAVGGKLSLLVEFPDQPPVFLAGLGENASGNGDKTKSQKGARATAKSKAGTRRAA